MGSVAANIRTFLQGSCVDAQNVMYLLTAAIARDWNSNVNMDLFRCSSGLYPSTVRSWSSVTVPNAAGACVSSSLDSGAVGFFSDPSRECILGAKQDGVRYVVLEDCRVTRRACHSKVGWEYDLRELVVENYMFKITRITCVRAR